MMPNIKVGAKIQLIILKLHMQDYSPAPKIRNEQLETAAPPIAPPPASDDKSQIYKI